MGVTATPQRIDGQGFQDLFDDLVVGISTDALIQSGYLSKFRLFATNQTISTTGVKTSRGDFRVKELAVAVTSQIGVDEIFQSYLKYAFTLRTVIFACSLEHSKALAAEFCRQGIKAEHLDGLTKPESRVQILERFRTGATQVITNYEILTEGYDCPNIECIYCVRPTQSSTTTAEFLSQNAGLFHVETTTKFVNISLEIENIPNQKLKLLEVYKSEEIQSAFSQGFGKQAKVMLRLAPTKTESQSA